MSKGQLSKETLVQGDISPRDSCPRRLWSKETLVQGDNHMYFSPRKKFCQNQTKLWVISQNSSFRDGHHVSAQTQQAQTWRPDLGDAGSSDRGSAPT